MLKICVGAEKKRNESRAALSPRGARALSELGLPIAVQSCGQRVFPDSLYAAEGIPVVSTTEGYDILAATKEFRRYNGTRRMHPGQILLGFHHSHKAQPYNLPYLYEAMELGTSFFDYELYRHGSEQPISTSRFAGIAGCVNGLAVFGQKRKMQGRPSVFSKLPKPGQFGTVEALREQIESLGRITEDIRIVVVGSGQCGRGAEEVCKWLKIPRVTDFAVRSKMPGPWFTVLTTADIVHRLEGGTFNQREYREHGSAVYGSRFQEYLGGHNLLVFCPYWDERYPKALPQSLMAERHADLPEVISDVTCDIGGSTECTLQESTVDDPVFTYFVGKQSIQQGFDLDAADGFTVTAVDNLPAQIAASCSEAVSDALVKVLPFLARMDRSRPLSDNGLPPEMQAAFLTYNGVLTPQYAHLANLM